MTGPERFVDIESVRIPPLRTSTGALAALSASIRDEGMRRPITLWKDGTLLSGSRRWRACVLLRRPAIQAVFVDTIEDAAKRLLGDNEDDYLALPLKLSEVCRLWELLRHLDAPAAALRADAARRRGVELRRLTQAGQRQPGRSAHSEDYVLSVLCAPFGMSSSTAKRLWIIHCTATGCGNVQATDERREQARDALKLIDAGESSIYSAYDRLTSDRGPAPRPRPVATPGPVPAARQITAWSKSLPQMEGLVAGLAELGPPNAELTWDQVGPVHARLMTVRRDLEKIIKKMRETSES
jgi:hypothetical protein